MKTPFLALLLIFLACSTVYAWENSIIPVNTRAGIYDLEQSNSTEDYQAMNNDIQDCKVWNSKTVYCGTLTGIYKSSNYGASWKALYASTNWYNVRRLFISSKGYIFYARDMNETLYRSNVNNDKSWSPVLHTICSGSTFWNLAEDRSGNIYAGEYSSLTGVPCAYIWKTTNNGVTWKIVYNSSSYGLGAAAHIHFVAVDPYTNYVYAVQDSDGYGFGRTALILSKNGGNTWTLVKSDARSSYTTIQFMPNARILGEDSAWAGNSSIVMTKDDKVFTPVLVLNGSQNGNFYSSVKTSNGVLVFGTAVQSDQNNPTIWKSYDGGISWNLSKDLGPTGQWTGVYGISNQDSAGYMYVYNTAYGYGLRVKPGAK